MRIKTRASPPPPPKWPPPLQSIVAISTVLVHFRLSKPIFRLLLRSLGRIRVSTVITNRRKNSLSLRDLVHKLCLATWIRSRFWTLINYTRDTDFACVQMMTKTRFPMRCLQCRSYSGQIRFSVTSHENFNIFYHFGRSRL